MPLWMHEFQRKVDILIWEKNGDVFDSKYLENNFFISALT